MLFSLGRQVPYDKEKSENKPLLKTDAPGQSAHNDGATHSTPMMDNNGSFRDGALPVESPRAGRVPDPMPQRGPTQATGGHPVPQRGARLRRRRVNATGQKRTANTQETLRPLNILQWNAEGVFNKKLPFTERLYADNIDVACIQETHLNPNHRFTIRGYQTFRLDREGRHKGGVLMLIKNNIPAQEIKLDTNQQAEVQGVNITMDSSVLTIYNLYCPPDKDLPLQYLGNLPTENCLVVGDFNSHSTCWGYEETDKRGEEVEDWQIDAQMVLLNDPEDPPTFFSRRWLSTSTPDLAFATDDLSKKISRGVLSQLGGSDHRPVKLAINLQYRPQNSTTFPRWNYKKADWNMFTSLTDLYTRGLKTDDLNINRVTRNFNQAILKAASETIPRGARKNYRPYWTEELQELEDEVSISRQKVEENPSVDNNIALKAATAKYRRAYHQAARSSWREKTEKLNLDRDGNKLWKLTKAINDENTRAAPITISQDQELLTGRKAANLFIDSYEEVSNITVPQERKARVQKERRTHREEEPEEHMNKPFNLQELADAMKALQERKSPGPDKITNEMLLHLGTRAKTQLLKIFNNSWKTGHVPQIWREADMVPIHKKGKDRAKVDSYRPISLTSCVGKLMERMINTRLTWHLEKNNIISPEQAGFRQNHSTEDQVTYIAQKIEDGFQDKKHTLTIWIDMEKAFDKVWKDGLMLKLQKSGVAGCMFQWICQYLNSRKARVHVNGQYSRKKTLKNGVPQGGVLSPTLFLIFINDIVKDLPRSVHGAIYADDLALWCSEEHITTANYRMQEALKVLEDWTKKWLVNINITKTTYTIFSLSPKELKANLKLCGQTLQADNTPTYLGVTFDKRLTWKHQTEKVEARAKLRLALMKKLTGTTWGADAAILKKMYAGYVRPVLEYGVTAWGAAAKSNFDKVSKVQNQAARIITGAMRSTPIQELETITGLEPMEDRRDTKLLIQAAKLKRLPNHPMKARLYQPTKGRLKRGSFIHQTRVLEKKHQDILDHKPKDIPQCLEIPCWNSDKRPQIHSSIPGIGKKDSQSNAEKKSITMEYIHNSYPQHNWTHVYTDGSADQAVKNGGAGIYIRYPEGREEHISLATGLYSTNFKAEAVALRTGAAHIEHSPLSSINVVFFSDAKSVLQALDTARDKEMNDLSSALTSLCRAHQVILQWVPSHCNILGNEAADALAKEGTTKEQSDRSVTFKEAKTIIKAKQHSKWLQQHPQHNRKDPFHLLSRSEQVLIFRLRTGHNRMNHHLYTKFKIGQTDQCPCQTGSMTTEHLLQSCPLHDGLRHQIWAEETTVQRKLYGSLEDLQRTATFAQRAGVSI